MLYDMSSYFMGPSRFGPVSLPMGGYNPAAMGQSGVTAGAPTVPAPAPATPTPAPTQPLNPMQSLIQRARQAGMPFGAYVGQGYPGMRGTPFWPWSGGMGGNAGRGGPYGGNGGSAAGGGDNHGNFGGGGYGGHPGI